MSFLNEIFGSKPAVPKVTPLDLGTEQSKAIGNNISQLPQAESLVSSANQFSSEQITQMLQAAIPGYSNMTQTASSDIQSELSGQIPSDVSQAVTESGAAKSMSGGYGGSGMNRNLVARDLGLTSLALTQQGLSSAESWIKMSDQLYSPSMMNVSSMFVTPAQQASFDVEERNTQVQQQWLQNQISAMPDPVLAGIKSTIDSFTKSFLGGMGGGMGGGGGSDTSSGDWSADQV
jgi:hypothetical protein